MNDFIIFVIGFCTFSILHFFTYTRYSSKILKKTRNYIGIILFILFLQVFFSAIFKKEIGDVALFSSAGWYLRQRVDFYFIDSSHGSYPFFPFLIFYHAFANYLTEIFSFFTFSFYLKLLLIVSLYLISIGIYSKSAKTDRRINSLKFITSPVVYAVAIYHGQIDSLLILFYLASIYFYFNKNRIISGFFAGFLFGLSVATKTWSLFFIPLIFKFRQRLSIFVYFIIAATMFILFDLYVYIKWVKYTNLISILEAVTKAGGPTGFWGITYILSKAQLNNEVLYFGIFLISLIITQIIILRMKIDIVLASFITILGIYIFIPRWGIQYLIWVYPLMYLAINRLEQIKVKNFVVISSVYIFFSYSSFSLGPEIKKIAELTGIILWLYIIYWFVKLIKEFTTSNPSFRHL